MLYLPFARDRRLWLESPYLRGRAQNTSNTTCLTTVTSAQGTANALTTDANVGDIVFLATAMSPISGTDTYTLTDSASNSWTKLRQSIASLVSVGLWVGRITTQIPATTGSVTVTNSNGATGGSDVVFMWKITPNQFVIPVVNDGSGAATGTGTAATCASVTPTNDPDYIVTVCGNSGGATGTPSAGFTELVDTAGALCGLQVNQLVNNNKSAVTPGETLASSTGWAMIQGHVKMTFQARLPQPGYSIAAAGAVR